jgi:GntR family carbon starvation induced transcriptional regulator
MTTRRLATGDDERPRQTLASTIAINLRRSIMRGDLPPGAKLHVEELRERFDVSLSPLREALSRLGSAGFVEIEDQRGYRVAAVSDENLSEVIRLRMELESLALLEWFFLAGCGL